MVIGVYPDVWRRHLPSGTARNPTKFLFNVSIERSTGALHVLTSPESTVQELIAEAIRQYAFEGRRPVLNPSDASRFELHYSPFSLESLNNKEKLIDLESRSFYMCLKAAATHNATTTMSTLSFSSKEVDEIDGDSVKRVSLWSNRFANLLPPEPTADAIAFNSF